MTLLSKKGINSVLTWDFCRRFFMVLGKLVNIRPSIAVLIPDQTGSTRFHLTYDVFQKQWILVTHGNEVGNLFYGLPSYIPPHYYDCCYSCVLVDPAGPVDIILASGSEVLGFHPGRGRWIFLEHKSPEYNFLRKGSKVVGPVS